MWVYRILTTSPHYENQKPGFLSHWLRIGYLVVAVAVTMHISVALSSCSQPEGPPELIIDESVASDFETLAMETWDEFLTVFQARTSCFGDVRLRATRTLGSRAAYDPDSATVTVRVPGTPAMLQSALVHEWAHHVEFQCDEHKTLRPAFLDALGLPPDTQWRPEVLPVNTSADMPSEQYAEATIVLVLGRRQIPNGVRITEDAIRAVEEWAAGD
jgi:hypothetical protein